MGSLLPLLLPHQVWQYELFKGSSTLLSLVKGCRRGVPVPPRYILDESIRGIAVVSELSYPVFMKGITIKLPEMTLRQLRQEARATGRSVAEIVRGCLENRSDHTTARALRTCIPTERL